jgi:hypothetical protein
MERDTRYIEYLRRWETLGPEMERLRDEEIRNADTRAAIYLFDSAFKNAMRELASRESTGLIAWGDVINKWRLRRG